MVTYYDKIANRYKNSKTLPFREYIELYSYFRILGDISEKSILDLACGEGFYTRRIKAGGATKAVGVDISEKMISLARQQEATEPLGIDYMIGDVMEIDRIGSFDLVIASYLLNYARSKEELLQMCKTIADNLKPSGRFVAINNNPSQSPDSFHTCKKYGFTKSIPGELKEGTTIIYDFFQKGQKFRIENYYLSRNTHEWAFKQAGFKVLHWKKIEVSPLGIQKYGKEYWLDFLKYSPIIGIESYK